MNNALLIALFSITSNACTFLAGADKEPQYFIPAAGCLALVIYWHLHEKALLIRQVAHTQRQLNGYVAMRNFTERQLIDLLAKYSNGSN